MLSFDPATLDMRDALDLAILIEEEARERYEEFVAQMDATESAEPAAFFRHMVENESKHGKELAGKRRALFGDAPVRVNRKMLWDEEAPEYESVRAFMSARQAMEVALAAEIKAQAFFLAAKTGAHSADVAALFDELAREELMHQEMVERELAKLPPSPPSSAEEYADEPVAQ
jgi:rubrerythrin